MRKLISTTLACILVAMTMSCGKGIGNGNSDKNLDTLSYIVGMNIANQIEKGVMPQLKADYDVIVETLESGLNGQKEFTVEGVTINKEAFRELGMKYFGPELREKVEAAMADTTGMTEVFSDPAEKKIASTLLGADFAFSLENAHYEIVVKKLMQAISDVHNNKPALTDEKANAFMENYFTVVIPAQNEKLSKEWLAEIEKEEGVQKTESGILYKIVDEGDIRTKAINDTDVVKVLYTGKTREEKVFDSNRWADMPQQRQEMIKAYQPDQAEKDNPIEFPLNRVIKGWTEGMKLVGKGGRIILWIPGDLAYGEAGAGQDIGPNEALCFDVELLDVRVAEQDSISE
ncbi:MAG: hypothetical protein E7093_07150 [Bacteroidales bacterium]|nr:hypothetical protein [Bacteroidales bacterium]